MPSVTTTQLRDRFPNVFPSTFPTAVLASAIGEAYERIDIDLWGDLADRGAMWLAASLALGEFVRTSSSSGSSGALASRSTLVGSESYDNGSGSESLSGISGQAESFYNEYLRIARLITPAFAVSES